jgi:hypothetical protein
MSGGIRKPWIVGDGGEVTDDRQHSCSEDRIAVSEGAETAI